MRSSCDAAVGSRGSLTLSVSAFFVSSACARSTMLPTPSANVAMPSTGAIDRKWNDDITVRSFNWFDGPGLHQLNGHSASLLRQRRGVGHRRSGCPAGAGEQPGMYGIPSEERVGTGFLPCKN